MKLLLQANDGKTIIREFDLTLHTENIMYPGGPPCIIGRKLTDDLIGQLNQEVQEEWALKQ